jgi:uncharacterized protein YcbX
MRLVGVVRALYRYPVKSMAGTEASEVGLGWHGVVGDRRLALRKLGDLAGFPWLTASRLPALLRYAPSTADGHAPTSPTLGGAEYRLPSHIDTPDGERLMLFGQRLAREISERAGLPVEMTHLDRGIFDESVVSLISSASVHAIASRSATPPDVRRFRPNIVVTTPDDRPFAEDDWVGASLTFGDPVNGATIAVTHRDVRCAMVNVDPDTAYPDPEVLRTIVRERERCVGVYAAVLRSGSLTVGQPVYAQRPISFKTLASA